MPEIRIVNIPRCKLTGTDSVKATTRRNSQYNRFISQRLKGCIYDKKLYKISIYLFKKYGENSTMRSFMFYSSRNTVTLNIKGG
jgi:hypothetical protein